MKKEYDFSNGVRGAIDKTTMLAKRRKLRQLIGRERFNALDEEICSLLANLVGGLDFGVPIDIKETMNYGRGCDYAGN